eukprot:SAG31_NODE_457_length_15415_cov_4.380387_17_plen_112_part_00
MIRGTKFSTWSSTLGKNHTFLFFSKKTILNLVHTGRRPGGRGRGRGSRRSIISPGPERAHPSRPARQRKGSVSPSRRSVETSFHLLVSVDQGADGARLERRRVARCGEASR